jgi:hypothetical protein
MKKLPMVMQAHKSPGTAGKKMRKDTLSAVSRELQLKYQDSGIAVTNWDRIR